MVGRDIYINYICLTVVYPGFQRGGVLKVRSDTKSGGGGGGGGQYTSGPIRKVWAFVWRTGNTHVRYR